MELGGKGREGKSRAGQREDKLGGLCRWRLNQYQSGDVTTYHNSECLSEWHVPGG